MDIETIKVLDEIRKELEGIRKELIKTNSKLESIDNELFNSL